MVRRRLATMKPDPYTPPGQEAIYALREARALVAPESKYRVVLTVQTHTVIDQD